MSNFDKAVEVLNKHWSVAQESVEADETRCCVRHLQEAGLLAADLPKPDRFECWWQSVGEFGHVHTSEGEVVFRSGFFDGPLGMEPDEARNLALALLAAADYAEQEQKP